MNADQEAKFDAMVTTLAEMENRVIRIFAMQRTMLDLQGHALAALYGTKVPDDVRDPAVSHREDGSQFALQVRR